MLLPFRKKNLFFLTLFFSCISAQSDTTLVIFVHGIFSPQPFLDSWHNISILKNDQISNTAYEYAVKDMRKNPFFYQHHAMQGMGLQKVDPYAFYPGKAASALAFTFEEFSKKLHSPKKRIYYTYGWSALLSNKQWQLEAELFYTLISQELKKYHNKDIFPHVQIIAYSHGCTMALKLSDAHEKIKEITNVKDVELVLLGLPVNDSLYPSIESPLFKKIVNIYSYGDRVQVWDIFSAKYLFSDRVFKNGFTYSLPKNLYQVEFRVTRPTQGFLSQIKKQDPHTKFSYLTKRNTIKLSPGHTELWSWGWTAGNYRKNSLLYPFPAAAFIPYIIHGIFQVPPKDNHVTFEILPTQELIMVQSKTKYESKLIPFLNPQEREKLLAQVLKFKPISFTAEEYKHHLQSAISRAEEKVAELIE